jgi:acyl carrier protein
MMIDGKTIAREIVARDVCQIIESTRPRLAGLVKPTTLLTSELRLDSLAFIEIAIGIEERFGIAMGEIEELEVERLVSAADLIDMVVAKLHAVGQ